MLEAMPPDGPLLHRRSSPTRRSTTSASPAARGITPLLSIIKTVLAAEPQADLHPRLRQPADRLDHVPRGARGPEEPLPRPPLDRPRPRVARRRTSSSSPAASTRRSARQLFRTWIDLPSITTAFICGPEPMMLAIAGALKERRARRRADQVRALRLWPTPGRTKQRAVSHEVFDLELHRGHGDARRRHPQLPHAEGRPKPARRRAPGQHRRTLRLQGRGLLHLPRQGDRRRGRDGERTTRSRTTRSARATCSPASASR